MCLQSSYPLSNKIIIEKNIGILEKPIVQSLHPNKPLDFRAILFKTL